MRPPRLILLVFCFIFCPIFLTFYSVLSSSSRLATPDALADQTSGLHALFSFSIPSSLFPPSAIISLTDDNSTFFLARPAAFGPGLATKGLSGQLWVGGGFGEGGPVAGVDGELGCSDIPGWEQGDATHHKQDKSTMSLDKTVVKSVSSPGNSPGQSQSNRRTGSKYADSLITANDGSSPPPPDDGTDDHLHHPLPQSDVGDSSSALKRRDNNNQIRPAAHADIQSLQESAEIAGRVVLLSRGGCGFLEKVKWVQRRGGIALIVGDDTRGGSLVTMYARGDTSNVTIPSLFTSHTTAQLLSSLIPPQVGEEPNPEDGLKASRTKLSTQSSTGKSRAEPSTTTSATPTPTSTKQAVKDEPLHRHPEGKTGLFSAVWSLLGLGSNHGQAWPPLEDSRRPPSSGNIDWVLMDGLEADETTDVKAAIDLGKPASVSQNTKKSMSNPGAVEGDGFVIGVQDWRDPDLVPPKGSVLPSSSGVALQETTKSRNSEKGSAYPSTSLKGGSITPGSGEYRSIEKSRVDGQSNVKSPSGQSAVQKVQVGSPASSKSWISRFFGRTNNQDDKWAHRSREQEASPKATTQESSHSQSEQNLKTNEHEGLWVTLTPTSMSTSPFFDTLLVLVVSPLITLTVVYTLLLLRSRIRRRRWRAPKSIVERLPVRTYHTIASSASSTASSSQACNPDSASPTSPLLVPGESISRSESQTVPGSEGYSKKTESQGEKVSSGSALWRRKYTGRQVECVVCLEEYVDGQSRVMSLPCGHEFHAECITPWLTTRRRTCPICKGDVVRSMSNHRSTRTHRPGNERAHTIDPSASSAPVPLSNLSEDELSDTEQNASSDARLLGEHASSAPPSSWRNFASSFSFSALSGDTIWNQARADRSR